MKANNALAILLLTGALGACGYRPARFSTEPARWYANDEQSIPLPETRHGHSALYHLEAYGERALVSPLEVSRPPVAVDVNRFDEVVRSSWYRGRRRSPLAEYERDGAPVAPFLAVDATPALPGAAVIDDARGLRYEIIADRDDYPEARTAAAAIASRLVHALGYRTPEAHVVTLEGGARAVAIRWPAGVDLGPTPMLWTRFDDPNDVLEHIHRRTLRASAVFALWLGIDDFHEHAFRDVYVGRVPHGFVRHYFVGLEEALGSESLEPEGEAPDPGEDGSSATLLLLSFGFTPKRNLLPRALPYRGVASFAPNVSLDVGSFQPPFAPHQRMRPDDAYWAGKAMAAIDRATLAAAVDAGELTDPRAVDYLVSALERRRTSLLREIFAAVTPCEPTRLEDNGDGSIELLLVDHALRARVTKPRRYSVEVVDDAGETIVAEQSFRFARERHTLRLPGAALRSRGYAVVRLTATVAGEPLDRSADIHLGLVDGKLRLLGVEH